MTDNVGFSAGRWPWFGHDETMQFYFARLKLRAFPNSYDSVVPTATELSNMFMNSLAQYNIIAIAWIVNLSLSR